MINYLLVWFSTFIISILCVIYMKAVNKENAILSALYDMLLYSVGAISTIYYIENHWMLLPAALGGGMGTYLSVKYYKNL